jgi:hypothetical protein
MISISLASCIVLYFYSHDLPLTSLLLVILILTRFSFDPTQKEWYYQFQKLGLTDCFGEEDYMRRLLKMLFQKLRN